MCTGHSSIHLGVCRAQLYTPGCVQGTALYTWVCTGHSSIHWMCACQFLCGSCVRDAFCRTFACYACFSVTLVYVMLCFFFFLSSVALVHVIFSRSTQVLYVFLKQMCTWRLLGSTRADSHRFHVNKLVIFSLNTNKKLNCSHPFAWSILVLYVM